MRRTIGEPLNARELFGAPVVLLVIGGYSLTKVPDVTGVDVAWLGGVGLVLGVWRGATVRLMVKDGVLWQRYPARTYLVWVVSLAVIGGLGVPATQVGMHANARPMTLSRSASVCWGRRSRWGCVRWRPGCRSRGKPG